MAGGRILFLINSLAGGGAERVMMTLIAASRAEMGDHPFSLAVLDEEVVVYPPPAWLPVRRLDTGGSLVRGVRAVMAIARRERPALIVSFLTRANIIAVLVGRVLGCRVVISERVNTSAHLAGSRASRLLVRLAYRRADRVIAVSEGVAEDLRRNFAVPAEKLVVINNPVDIEAITSRANEPAELPVAPPYLVAMGRLTKTKNPALAIAAYARAGIEPALLVLGEGPERPALEQFVVERGLQDRVRLLGFAANPFPLLAAAQAYVSPSNGEGFPNALVEAMALGVPVLATNCASGPSEILADRRRETVVEALETPYGVLVPVNDPDAMAAAMRRLTADPARLREMGAAGRQRATEYSVTRAVTRYWRVFREAISR